MEKITKEYKVFEFKELSEETKQTVIDKWYENEDYPFLEENIEEQLNQIDEYNIFDDVKLQYSLSWSQGDGLSFSAEINLKAFLDNIYLKKLPEWKKNGIKEYIFDIHSKGNTGHYCYAHRNDVDFNYNYQDNIERPNLEKLWDKIFEQITEYYLEVCEKLEKFGYSILEYRMDFDEFSELCESNEYKFLENGEMFN
jgi:hypothetical protein